MEQLLNLLQSYNITNYEITDKRWGVYTKTMKEIKQLIIYDHFIHDHESFNKLGYGIIQRNRNEQASS
jgi:hypothetical protein